MTNVDPPETASKPWWSRHFVAISGGLGVGLLAYRYGVLPFVVETKPADMFLWIGIGFLVGAGKGFKAGLGDVTSGILSGGRLVVGLIAAALSFGVGFFVSPPFGYLHLKPHALPGFTVSLPKSEVANTQHSENYAEGRLILRRPGGIAGYVQVKWAPGGLPDQSEVMVLARLLAGASGGDPAEVTVEPAESLSGDLPSTTWVVRTGALKMWLSFSLCGSRCIFIEVMASDSGADRLLEHIVRSLQCRPDPVRERDLSPPHESEHPSNEHAG